MDPLLFGIQGDVVIEALGTVVIFSLVIERFLSTFFEWRVVLRKIADKHIKEPIAFLLSLAVVYFYQFDAMAIILSNEHSSILGYLLTAGLVSGGSKGSVKLFRDFLGWKSTARKEYEASLPIPPEPAELAESPNTSKYNV